LVAFYPLYPVCRENIEEHGSPEWTREGKLVSNGAFQLQLYRMRDRIRMVKSDTYWGRDKVQLNIVDALAVKGETTMLNLYMQGQTDWINTVPNTVVPELLKRDDFHSAPMLTTYFYRLNVNHQALRDVGVRQALGAAINKQAICDAVLRAGQLPARSFVPPGLSGYQSSLCGEYDLEAARKLLADAGYPNGVGLPKIQIVYNTSDDHRAIAEVIQQEWSKLGIRCELRNLEWGTFLDTLTNTKFDVARSAWVGDYPDPNTFLDMFVTNGPNNQTNWSNAEYDKLIEEAKYLSGDERMAVLTKAERILMDELPIIPIYFYVSKNMVNPKVKGFYNSIQDLHPIEILSVEP
jgi:oligopeptide transport system substrate-binding protein